MIHDLRQVLRIECVQDVEKVLPWRTFALRKSCWEVRHEISILFEFRPEILDAQLVVLGDLDEPDLGLLEHSPIADQDILDEILVDHVICWQIVLYYMEINDG